MIVELKRARQFIETDGWVGPSVEPYCIARGPGFRLNPAALDKDPRAPLYLDTKSFWTLEPEHQEVVLAYSVEGACRVAGVAFGALETATGLESLQTWLQQPQRTKSDVLRAFVRAIERSKKARTGERR